MTTTTTPGGVAPDVTETHLVRTARTTGLFYLAFFITGIPVSYTHLTLPTILLV